MQDNVTVSHLEAWSSAGVVTVMEETREGAAGETVERRRKKKDGGRVAKDRDEREKGVERKQTKRKEDTL